MEILKRIFLATLLLLAGIAGISAKVADDPVYGLVERICPGSSKHFIFELEDELCEKDFFKLDNRGSKVLVTGNNWISVATGLNWYLKYYAHANITWGNMRQIIAHFPKVAEPVRHETDCLVRYYLDYNTFTYSTPFWDWKRWQEEIDFMALHGINTPLMLTGNQSVWIRTLERVGYSREEALKFLGDATHQAQVLQGNMEGSADSISDDWFFRQEMLADKILREYEKWGMSPVLPGFSGIVPGNFAAKTGCSTIDREGKPSILNPAEPRFREIASVYYEELHRLYGASRFYRMDPPFDTPQMGQAVWECMDNFSPESVWITCSWKNYPNIAMIDGIPAGRLIVLDNESDSRPKWGDPDSPDYSAEGYIYHNWVFCQKLDYGGRSGMYGRMQRIINSYFLAKKELTGKNLSGVGATMDAVGNNPVMWELLFELPWRSGKFLAFDWLKQFVHARYGHSNDNLVQAWDLLAESVYSADSIQEGPSESVFCARPALSVSGVSKNGTTQRNYDSEKVIKALRLFLAESERLKYSDNYNFDIVDIASTVNADAGYSLLKEIEGAFDRGDTTDFNDKTDRFLDLILMQNTLMNCRRETMVGNWIESAMACGTDIDESELMRRDARRLITTWGDREQANRLGMHDYACRQWGGLLKDFHYERWRSFFSYIRKHGVVPMGYDWFGMENDWVEATNPYSFTPSTGSASIARYILEKTQN